MSEKNPYSYANSVISGPCPRNDAEFKWLYELLFNQNLLEKSDEEIVAILMKSFGINGADAHKLLKKLRGFKLKIKYIDIKVDDPFEGGDIDNNLEKDDLPRFD